ncbi:DUF559 domain-containing protein [Mycobacterium sp. NPDC006124]|uniref:endonuclease domain-containing protein n=1 Tax=Mycobacterium sp. NPDC006124 TaxID=3156729 RepID=UPI0033ACDD2E
MAQPFLGTEALAAGTVSRRTLRSRCDRVYRNVYVHEGATMTAADRAVAAWLWSGRQSVLVGLSASAMHGSKWIDPALPAEVNRRNGKPVAGILVRRDEMLHDEVQSMGALVVSTPARTAFDLGRRPGLTLAVVRVDALANATGVQPGTLEPLVARHAGVRGLRQLRKVMSLMDGGAESPQETRTRLLLVGAGMPPPRTQIVVDEWRIDMGWEDLKVGVEYDGVQHWTDSRQHQRDIDRHAELLARGWRIVRVSADMLRHGRTVIIRRTCEAVRQSGAEWPSVARFSDGYAA